MNQTLLELLNLSIEERLVIIENMLTQSQSNAATC